MNKIFKILFQFSFPRINVSLFIKNGYASFKLYNLLNTYNLVIFVNNIKLLFNYLYHTGRIQTQMRINVTCVKT